LFPKKDGEVKEKISAGYVDVVPESFRRFVQNIGKFVQKLKCFVQTAGRFLRSFFTGVKAFSEFVCFLTRKVRFFRLKCLTLTT
jgi:hypothetical protein